MTPDRSRTPIVRFFGDAAAIGGPFALLGVEHHADAATIQRARERRLAQIDQHPHRATPDADEARLAVHSAVSQLLDPTLRHELEQRWPPGTPEFTPPAWRARTQAGVSAALVRSARRTLGSCGGWNPRARRRLAHLARVHRVSAYDLLRALGAGATHAKPAASAPRARVWAAPRAGAFWWVVYSLLVGMIGVLGVRMLIPPNPERFEPIAITSVDPLPTSNTATAAPTTPAVRTIRHYSALIHEFASAAGIAGENPSQAAHQTTQYLPAFFAQWTAFPPDELERSVGHILRVADAARPLANESRTLAGAMATPASFEDPVQLSASIALRTLAARPADQREPFADALRVALGKLAAESASDDPSWWGRWVLAARSTSPRDPDASSALMLDALSAQLRRANPTPGWSRTAELFAAELTWRPGSPERIWMLNALSEPANNAARLAALTNAVATHSSATGIEVTMTLRPNASADDRQALAERYRDAWMQSGEDDPLIDRLRDELLIAVSMTPVSLDAAHASARLEELLRLNTASTLADQGRTDEALLALDDPAAISDAPAGADSLGLARSSDDDRTAIDLLNAAEELMYTKLVEVQAAGRVGPNTAHALVRLASPPYDRETRDAAAQALFLHREELSVLVAIERMLVKEESRSIFRKVVERVLDEPIELEDEAWDAEAHRRLLSRMNDAVARVRSPQAAPLAERIAGSYALRVRGVVSADADAIERITDQLLTEQGVSALNEGVGADELERIIRAREIRRTRASGVPQRFVADQLALTEILACTMRRRVPGSTSNIDQILAELRTRLHASAGLEDQLAQIERAQSRLWLLCFQEGRL